MENMTNMNDAVSKVSNKMVEAFDFAVEVLGSDSVDSDWFNQMLNAQYEIEEVSFENETAKFNFSYLVEINMPERVMQVVRPVALMDENGNYTSDKSKWA